MPTAWTGAGDEDPFVVFAAGRSSFRTQNLLTLADLIDQLDSRSDSAREITPSLQGRGRSPAIRTAHAVVTAPALMGAQFLTRCPVRSWPSPVATRSLRQSPGEGGRMARRATSDPKEDALRMTRTLYPRLEGVIDAVFLS